MLSRLLANHNELALTQGETRFISQVYANRNTFGKIGSEKQILALENYIVERNKKKWKDFSAALWLKYFKELQGRTCLDLYFSLLATFAELLYPDKPEKYYIGDKNPHNIKYIKYLYRVHPNTKMIVIIRDPRAVVSSMLQMWRFKHIADAILIWKQSIRLTRKAVKKYGQEKMIVVYYEELLQQPEQVMATISQFLDIENSPRLTESGFNRDKTKAFDLKRLEKYKSALTNEQITIIEYLCKNEMKAQGYHPQNISDKVSIKQKFQIMMRLLVFSIKWQYNKFILVTGHAFRFQNAISKFIKV